MWSPNAGLEFTKHNEHLHERSPIAFAAMIIVSRAMATIFSSRHAEEVSAWGVEETRSGQCLDPEPPLGGGKAPTVQEPPPTGTTGNLQTTAISSDSLDATVPVAAGEMVAP